MTEESRAQIFFEGLDEDTPDWLLDIRDEAVSEDVPVIRDATFRELRFFIKWRRPGRILEVGTGTGYSALSMWYASGMRSKITTIEKYDKRIIKARENIAKCRAGEYIELLEGDAADILPELSGQYPFIFMDAAKGQYPHFLPWVIKLLSPGGMLITDNILQDEDMLRSRYAVRRRDRTIHARMREYLYTLMHHEQLNTMLLEDGDGLAVSVKKETE